MKYLNMHPHVCKKEIDKLVKQHEYRPLFQIFTSFKNNRQVVNVFAKRNSIVFLGALQPENIMKPASPALGGSAEPCEAIEAWVRTQVRIIWEFYPYFLCICSSLFLFFRFYPHLPLSSACRLTLSPTSRESLRSLFCSLRTHLTVNIFIKLDCFLP